MIFMKFSTHTIRAYLNDLDQFRNFVKNYNQNILFTEVDKTVVQYYIQKLSKSSVAEKTLLRKIACLKSFYKFLVNFDFMDTYDLIEKKTGISINQIFDESGESYFRKLEEKFISKVLV